MAIIDLAQHTTKTGAVNAVWYDDEEENFVVQHEFVHLSFYKHDFQAFLETLQEAWQKFQVLAGGK